jgi:2-dehydro-3-deoxygluconokinase
MQTSTDIDLVTIGESMVLFQPQTPGAFAYAPQFVRSVGGAESNVAITLSRLGKKTRWISRLGRDPFGDIIQSTIAGEGVDVSFVTRDDAAPTAVFFRENKGYGDPTGFYYRRGSAASLLSPRDVRPEWLQGVRHLHVTGITSALGEETHEAIVSAMKLARGGGLTISFDPNLRRKLWDEATAREKLLSLVPLCDIFLPGLEEAEFLLGQHSHEEYGRLFQAQGPSVVVVKLGEKGSVGFIGEQTLHVPAYPIQRVVDSVGAGDAFASGLLSVLLDKQPVVPMTDDILERALRRANLMGALATQFAGDWEALPHLAEVEQLEAGNALITR